MYISTLKQSSTFLQGLHFRFINRYLFMIVLGLTAIFLTAYILDIPVGDQTSSRHQEHSIVPAVSASPLTIFDDPQYVHEYTAREQYITERLEMLRNKTRADRAYAVSYSYGSSRFGKMRATKIYTTFEVGLEGIVPQISHYQNLSRMDWLHLKSDAHVLLDGLFPVCPQSYGMELYDEHEAVIGYLGVDYLKERPAFRGNEMQLLWQTAASIEEGFLQPVEHLKGK